MFNPFLLVPVPPIFAHSPKRCRVVFFAVPLTYAKIVIARMAAGGGLTKQSHPMYPKYDETLPRSPPGDGELAMTAAANTAPGTRSWLSHAVTHLPSASGGRALASQCTPVVCGADRNVRPIGRTKRRSSKRDSSPHRRAESPKTIWKRGRGTGHRATTSSCLAPEESTRTCRRERAELFPCDSGGPPSKRTPTAVPTRFPRPAPCRRYCPHPTERTR